MGRAGWNEVHNYAIIDPDGQLHGHSYGKRHLAAGHTAVLDRTRGPGHRVIVYPAAMNIYRVWSRSKTQPDPDAIDQMGRLIRR